MNTTNIVTAVISDSNFTVASPILKEDKGLRLKIKGAVLPATYEVDFSLNRECGESVTMIGDGRGVEIPEYLIKTGKDIYAFLYWVGEDYSRTVYIIKIPNKSRPDRTDITPEPAQQSLIEQTIAKLNEAVEHAPKIGEDGYWYVWDPEEADYVSTGDKASAEDGVSFDVGPQMIVIPCDSEGKSKESTDVYVKFEARCNGEFIPCRFLEGSMSGGEDCNVHIVRNNDGEDWRAGNIRIQMAAGVEVLPTTHQREVKGNLYFEVDGLRVHREIYVITVRDGEKGDTTECFSVEDGMLCAVYEEEAEK